MCARDGVTGGGTLMNRSSEDSQSAQWLIGCYSGKAGLVAGSPGQSTLSIDKWPPKGRLPIL